MRRLALALLLTTGCPQTVQVLDGGAGGDGGAEDGGAGPADGGAEDGGAADGGAADGGASPCAALPFCLTLTPDRGRVNVGERVTVSATLVNPEARSLRMQLCEPEPRAERRPERPELQYSEIEHRVSVDGATGALEFEVQTVPPWFYATTFHVDVCVFEAQDADPALRVPVPIHVRGNVLFSAEYQGVFAVDSSGRPAAGIQGQYARGLVIDQTVSRATALRIARDGTLLVLDDAANPARIHRFMLDGADHRLSTVAHLAADLGGAAPIAYDNVAIHDLAELPDGAIAMADSHLSGTPNPRILVWNPDGTFRREVRGPNVQHSWQAVAAAAEGEWLVGMQDNLRNQVLRVDPATGLELPGAPFSDDLNKTIWAIELMPDGRALVVGDRLVTWLSRQGGAQAVTDIPGMASRDWRAATAFDGRAVVANDHQGDSENLALIRDGHFEGWLRTPGAGGPIIVPYGVAYLE